MTIELGRLATVAPREVWPHEAHDFTPWLLANVDVLSDLLGMDLELTAAEHPVGSFSLDLIGQDTSTGERVIVENQLEVSDHTHLGQIITYAAGTDPTTIVWITTGFRPEHRAAIDWLNERTDENTRIFGVVINVVRIGDSAYAPNFELVVQPNDWEKTVRAAAQHNQVSNEKTQFFSAYWEQFLTWARTQQASWVPRGKTTTAAFLNTGLGVQSVWLTPWFLQEGLTLQLYFGASDPELNARRYAAMESVRDALTRLLGDDLVWDPMPSKKACRLLIRGPFSSRPAAEEWDAVNMWILQAQNQFRDALTAVDFVSLMRNESESQ